MSLAWSVAVEVADKTWHPDLGPWCLLHGIVAALCFGAVRLGTELRRVLILGPALWLGLVALWVADPYWNDLSVSQDFVSEMGHGYFVLVVLGAMQPLVAVLAERWLPPRC